MGQVVEVTDSNFEQEVLKSEVPVLVDFWAAWCGPCKMVAPIVEDLAVELAGRLKVTKLDVDANQVTASRFGVMGIPTLLIFKAGQPAERIVGYQPKPALKSKVEAALA
ncbi:MAG: thioredoxin [Candidatus Dormibacteria bacterium]